MAKVSVVILNWNGLELLKKFLSGVVAHSQSEVCEVVVADNGSTDGSVEWVQQNFPEVKIIAFDQNYGFTGGYNRAINQLDTKYTVLLNSDVEIKEPWVENLLDIVENDPTVACVQPKILSQLRPEEFEYAGACGGYLDKYAFPFCRGRILSRIEKDKGQYDTVQNVFWATGAAMLVRNDLYKSCGGLDNDFFAHMEEIDLCWRFQNMGYKIVVQPKSKVYHVGGATLDYTSPRKLKLNFRNSLCTILKNTHSNNFNTVLFRRMLIDGILAIIYLLTFKIQSFKAVVAAHSEFRKLKPIMLEKRQQNIAISVANPKINGLYSRSIILNYIFGKNIFSKLKF